MCSIQDGRESATVADVVARAASLTPTALAEVLDGVLDHLLAADLSVLGADEHGVLVSRLVRHQNAQHAALLDAVAAFDASDIASTSRHLTTKRWLEHRTRLAPGTASALVRTARAVRDHLPDTREALASRSISAQHVGAITQVMSKVGVEHATAAEPILLSLARRTEPSVVRRATAEIHAVVDPAGAEKELHASYDRRGVTLMVSGDRAYLDGVLDLESAELLRTALNPLMTKAGPSDSRTVPQLRADALLDIAKQVLDAGTLPEMGGQRPHLSVVIDETALRSQVGAVTAPWTGSHLPAAVARRWSCDATLTPVLAAMLPPPGNGQPSASGSRSAVVLGGGWHPLDVGRTSRLATSAQTKALRVRDGGCVHPGCSRTPAYCDAHHVKHWADGGATSLDNMVLLCRHHHRSLHAGEWSLAPDPGQPGRFWASATGLDTPAQTAADRSPPVRVVGPSGDAPESPWSPWSPPAVPSAQRQR